MAKTVTRYESNDGVLWERMDLAEARDDLLRTCGEVDGLLGGRPPSLPHGTFVRRERVALAAFHDAVVELTRKLLPRAFDGQPSANDRITPRGLVARIVDDSNIPPLNKLWWRLACLDIEAGREYEQPYFVTHPSEAREVVA